MSANTPYGPAGGPEYLGSDPARTERTSGGSTKKWGVLLAGAVAVAGVIGVGGWGAITLLSGGGSQPAEVIPADAVGYLSLDLDPSADQKIEAISILRKFPGIKEQLDISDRDDLRRYVFEKIQDEGECTDLDYDRDVEPWIGDRIAMAGVPAGTEEVAPLMALQIKDREAATRGIDVLAKCGEAGAAGVGYAFSGDYVLFAETDEQAQSFADKAASASLADDAAFQQRMDEVGDSGIVTMYASAEAPARMAGLMDQFHPRSMSAPEVVALELTGPAVGPLTAEDSTGRMSNEMRKLYADFQGAAGVVRFQDGAVELELSAAGMPTGLPGGEGSGTGITELPASTGAAFALALPENWLKSYLEQMSAMMGEGISLEDLLTQLEAESGLDLPEDIETLLGDSVAVAFDADNDFEALEQSEDGKELLAGVRVQGDPDEIMTVVEKIKSRLGLQTDSVVVAEGEDVVAFGLNQGYVDGLAASGELGEDESFQDVVPNAEDASYVVFVNFDAGDGWAVELAELAGGGDAQARANVEPLDAFGISAWSDDDVQHTLLRLTTD